MVNDPVALDVELALAAIRVAVVSDPDADDVLVSNGIAVDIDSDAVAEDVSSAVAASGIAVLGAPVAALVPETAAAQTPVASEPDADGVEEAEAASGAGGVERDDSRSGHRSRIGARGPRWRQRGQSAPCRTSQPRRPGAGTGAGAAPDRRTRRWAP